jgi:hypothetical protein
MEMKLVSLENLKGKIRFPQVIEVPLSLSYLISQKSDLEDEMNNTWEGMAEFIDEWGASSILYIFEESKTHLNGLEKTCLAAVSFQYTLYPYPF